MLVQCRPKQSEEAASRLFKKYIRRREVALMTAYEIISIFIGILALLISFGSLIIALLAFLDKRNGRN
jgi:hypothetical protein